MIDKNTFKSFWTRFHNNIPPIGYVLRGYYYNDRWFRIHSLPNSKRYADNEDEMNIILYRQNTLIDDLIGEKSNYLVLLNTFSDTPNFNILSGVENFVLTDVIRLDHVLPEKFDTEIYLNSAIINKIWTKGSIDFYLKAVANENEIIINDLYKVDTFLIIDIKQNRIVAPYDGGVDVFLSSKQEKEYFKSKYNQWLSILETGF